MKRMMMLVFAVMLMWCSSAMALTKAEEKAILLEVVHSQKYELNEDEARLLFAIRRHENGPVGMEFGIGQDVGPGHKARRYAGQSRKSLRIQAMWAAGTIKRQFNGNLREFAAVWCQKGAEAWYKSVNSILMTEYAVAPR
jgi:hypothetical protein